MPEHPGASQDPGSHGRDRAASRAARASSGIGTDALRGPAALERGMRTPLPARPCVVGVDLSTRAIDFVRLDENEDHAIWDRAHLTGDSAWERIRDITAAPLAHVFENAYLVAIERPFSQSRNDSVRLAEGAILACIPRGLEVWEVAPQTWKAHIGFRGRGKPGWADMPFTPSYEAAAWPQDAIDALGVALYARDTNAAGIAESLGLSESDSRANRGESVHTKPYVESP